MKKNTLKTLALIGVLSCSLCTTATPVQAKEISNKEISISTTKLKETVKEKISEKKKERRKEFLRKQGVDEEIIQKLDELHFFDLSIKDLGDIDVSTADDIKVIIKDNNIDIDIYIGFINIGK